MIPETRELSALVAQALFDGRTLWVMSQPLRDGSAELHVPLPDTPGLYLLVLAFRTAQGEFATETITLDTTGQLELAIDAPPHLSVGDRAIASLTLACSEPTAERVRVRFDAGAGLHVDEVYALDPDMELERAADGTTFELTLAPLARTTLLASIEAAAAGPGRIGADVETADCRRRVSTSYDISDAGAAPGTGADRALVVRRRLFRLEKEHILDEEPPPGSGLPRMGRTEWVRVELGAAERVTPGDYLLVQEEFEPPRSWARVEWEQRLPANCHTYSAQWEDLRELSALRDTRLDGLTYPVGRLEAGRKYVHEYVIVPVRTGACGFPAPEVKAGTAAVGVQLRGGGGQQVLVAGVE